MARTMIIFKGQEYKSIREASIKLKLPYAKVWTEYNNKKIKSEVKTTSEALKKWR